MTIRRTARVLSAAAAVFVVAATVAGCGDSGALTGETSLVKSTTKIAGAGVLGNARHFSDACGPTAPLDPGLGTGTHPVQHAAGVAQVPDDPQRIVVLDAEALDTACALGLQDRVVGAATAEAGAPQPLYLGPAIAKVPAVGTYRDPAIDAIARLKPDLILGSTAAAPGMYQRLSAIAPTVFTNTTTPWRDTARIDGAAFGRGQAVDSQIEKYDRDARSAGRDLNAIQTQASIVRFTANSIEVYGPTSFPGQVMIDVGVARPQDQRFTDRRTTVVDPDQLEQADGDIIYVSFDGQKGLAHGKSVMNSDRWLDLGASTNRTFTVDDEIWMTGVGLVAAHDIVQDLRDSLNNYVG